MQARAYFATFLALCLAQGANAAAPSGVRAAGDRPACELRKDFARDPIAEARCAFALAGRTGRRVLIEVGGDWCHWCHVLDRLLAQPDLAARLNRAFVVLKIAVDEDHDAAEVLGGYPVADGYPYLYVVRADGRLIHAQDAVPFLEAGDYSARRVREFIDRWQDGNES